MYLKTLYRHHKWLFAIAVVFIAGQLFINLKQGIVFSPFYHYGMYSKPMPPDTAYTVIEVRANGELLQTKDFSPQQWDKIMQPLLNWQKQEDWNNAMYQEMHRLTRLSQPHRYRNQLSDSLFRQWYQQYLTTILNRPVSQISIEPKTFYPAR